MFLCYHYWLFTSMFLRGEINYTKAVGFHSKRIYGIIIETLYLLISTLEHNLRRESPSSCRNTEVMVLDFCPSILSLFWIQYYFSPSSVLYSLVFSLVILHLWVYLYFWFMFSCLCLFPVMSSACVSPVMFLFIPSMSHVCFPFTVTLCVPSYPSLSRLPCLSCVSVFFFPLIFSYVPSFCFFPFPPQSICFPCPFLPPGPCVKPMCLSVFPV